MVANLAARSLADESFPAVAMFRLAHDLGDDFPETQRSAARRILLESVVSFDDLDIDSGWIVSKDAGRHAGQLHRQVDRPAHVRRPDQRNGFRSTCAAVVVGLHQARWWPPPAESSARRTARTRPVSMRAPRNRSPHRSGRPERRTEEHPARVYTGESAGVFAQLGVICPFQCGDDRQCRIGGSESNQSSTHASRRAMNGDSNLCHFMWSQKSPCFAPDDQEVVFSL